MMKMYPFMSDKEKALVSIEDYVPGTIVNIHGGSANILDTAYCIVISKEEYLKRGGKIPKNTKNLIFFRSHDNRIGDTSYMNDGDFPPIADKKEVIGELERHVEKVQKLISFFEDNSK